MWGKIAGFAKKIAVSKAVEKSQSGNSSFFSAIVKAPIVLGAMGILLLFLMIVAPIIILVSSSPTTLIMQALDNSSKAEDDAGDGGGNVLLIAGHSYEPYCNQATNECRYTSKAGYLEPEETRSLVKLIRSELTSLGVNVDIANELLAPGDSQMNKSFYVELINDTEAFKQQDWSKYNYVLEIHFNAAGNGELQSSMSGPLLVKTTSDYSTEADKGIINAITKNLKTTQKKDSVQSINSINYFRKLDIPITYLETEFFDNKQAMENYTSKKSAVAKDIAKAIKEKYGNSVSGTRAEIVNRARKEIGKPYVWGATGPNSYDCSGFVGYALTGHHNRIGTTLTFWKWPEAKNPKPGDVAVKDDGNGNGHTGLYIGDGKMIHASTYGVGVIEGPVQSGMKIVVWPDLKDK